MEGSAPPRHVHVTVPLFILLAFNVDGSQGRLGVAIYAGGAVCNVRRVDDLSPVGSHSARTSVWRRADPRGHLRGHRRDRDSDVLGAVIVHLVVAPRVDMDDRRHRRGSQARRWSNLGHAAATSLYIVNGWVGVLIVPALWANGRQRFAVALLVAGGVVYTLGAAGFARTGRA